MIKLHHCWNCGKKLSHSEREYFFHCNKECRDACKIWNATVDFEEVEDPIEEVVLPLEQIESSSPQETKEPLFPCPHKRNCKTHREICMKAGHGPIGKNK